MVRDRPGAGIGVAMKQGPRLMLLGRQGSGKGTQAARLAARYGIDHLSTGELFRAAIDAGTALGQQARHHMDDGELVPDDVVIGVVADRLCDPAVTARGFVLDGFPRTDVQADALEEILAGAPLDLVAELEVPTSLVRERLEKRAADEDRDDDTAEAITRRLELYELETRPVAELYQRLGRLVVIDGTGDPDDVTERLIVAIDKRLGERPEVASPS